MMLGPYVPPDQRTTHAGRIRNQPWIGKRLEAGRWIAVCDALGLTIEADDVYGALLSIEEACDVLIGSLEEDGELESYVETRGLG